MCDASFSKGYAAMCASSPAGAIARLVRGPVRCCSSKPCSRAGGVPRSAPQQLPRLHCSMLPQSH